MKIFNGCDFKINKWLRLNQINGHDEARVAATLRAF
jgi:hypothetical protein